jgi:hypothetical protein
MSKTLRILLFLMLVFAASSALTQGCALCYTQAAGSGAKMTHALKGGILLLMFPPLCICLFLTRLAYQKRDRFRPTAPVDSQASESINAELGW